MPGKTNGTGHPTKADYEKLSAEHEALKAAHAAEKKAHAETKATLDQMTAAADSAKKQLGVAEGKVERLKAERDALPAAVQDAIAGSVTGPRPDEERWLFAANGTEGYQERFADLADEQRAKAERPNYYFSDPQDAVAAYEKTKQTELQ